MRYMLSRYFSAAHGNYVQKLLYKDSLFSLGRNFWPSLLPFKRKEKRWFDLSSLILASFTPTDNVQNFPLSKITTCQLDALLTTFFGGGVLDTSIVLSSLVGLVTATRFSLPLYFSNVTFCVA